MKVPETSVRLSRTAALGWTLVVLLTLAYVVSCAWLAAFSLQDYPNHLARAVAMADLLFHGGERFGAFFQFQFAPVPYVLADLVLAVAVELLGVHGASVFWIALVMLSLPAALLFFLRGTTLAAPERILILILGLYLSTDGFLLMGFLTFRLAVALTLAGFACVQRLRRAWSAWQYAAYCALIVLCYFIHLAALVFLLAAVGVSGALRLWLRHTSVRDEVYLLLPLILAALWQFAVATHAHSANGLSEGAAYDWGTWAWKARHLRWQFMHFYGTRADGRLDKILLLLLAVCVLWPLSRRPACAAYRKPEVLEMSLLAAVFFAMYIVMPSAYGDASYLDLRALAMVPIFLILCAAYLAADGMPVAHSRSQAAIALAVLLAGANLTSLTWHFARDNAWMANYRSIIAAVPHGARVLPVYPGTDLLKPFMHAASFAVIDRGAEIPYLFSGNRGNPQTYFRYKRLPYAPPQTWYYLRAAPATHVDWEAIACSYDFVLAMKPLELARIPIATTPVTENASAALLAVVKLGCASN